MESNLTKWQSIDALKAKYDVFVRNMKKIDDSLAVFQTDLAPVMPEFSIARATEHVQALAADSDMLSLSAKTGAGMADWLAWLRAQIQAHRQAVQAGDILQVKTQPEGAALHAAGGGS